MTLARTPGSAWQHPVGPSVPREIRRLRRRLAVRRWARFGVAVALGLVVGRVLQWGLL